MLELKQNIFHPTRTMFTSQKFGDNRACIDSKGKVFTKIEDTCPIGTTSLYQSLNLKGHNGWDSALWRGEPIYFPVSDIGITWKAKTEVDKSGGIGVDVISTKEILIPNVGQKGLIQNHPRGYYGIIKFRFWHLQKVNVYDGQEIKFGDLIGYGDSTGLSSGDHLHWSLKMCDATGRGINGNNGYGGAMDFSPFYKAIFCLDILGIKQKLTLIQNLIKVFFSLKNI